MADLVAIDRDGAVRRIAEVCDRFPEVAAALLFGSALSLLRPDSDIDVAVVRRPTRGEGADGRFRAGLQLESELLQQLGEYEGHAFDVTVLEPEQPLFAMTVLTEGRVCQVGDPEAYTDFLERVARQYGDDAPRYERALDEVLEEPVP